MTAACAGSDHALLGDVQETLEKACYPGREGEGGWVGGLWDQDPASMCLIRYGGSPGGDITQPARCNQAQINSWPFCICSVGGGSFGGGPRSGLLLNFGTRLGPCKGT